MTKEEKKAAIALAIKEHQDNHAAVKESVIPPGLDTVVTTALSRALGEKLAKIFNETT